MRQKKIIRRFSFFLLSKICQHIFMLKVYTIFCPMMVWCERVCTLCCASSDILGFCPSKNQTNFWSVSSCRYRSGPFGGLVDFSRAQRTLVLCDQSVSSYLPSRDVVLLFCFVNCIFVFQRFCVEVFFAFFCDFFLVCVDFVCVRFFSVSESIFQYIQFVDVILWF